MIVIIRTNKKEIKKIITNKTYLFIERKLNNK